MYNLSQILEPEHFESFLLPNGVLFYGDIESSNPGRIDGNVSGNVNVNSKLFIGEEATIIGNISAIHIIVQGKVEGNIDCKTKVVICNSAIVNGDILAETIDIKEGSVITGSVKKRCGNTSDAKTFLDKISIDISKKNDESKKPVLSLKEEKVAIQDVHATLEGWF